MTAALPWGTVDYHSFAAAQSQSRYSVSLGSYFGVAVKPSKYGPVQYNYKVVDVVLGHPWLAFIVILISLRLFLKI